MDRPTPNELTSKRGRPKSYVNRMASWLPRRSIRRTPIILQMEAVECGAAALGIILAYYGAWIPLEQLRIACGVSRDGSKASNIIRAARRYGLTAKGYSIEPPALAEMPMPCIIHWNFNHFVVLEGIDGKRAYINDPAIGRRRIDMVELDLAFTGVVLAFERGEAFEKAGSKPKGMRCCCVSCANQRPRWPCWLLSASRWSCPISLPRAFPRSSSTTF